MGFIIKDNKRFEFEIHNFSTMPFIQIEKFKLDVIRNDQKIATFVGFRRTYLSLFQTRTSRSESCKLFFVSKQKYFLHTVLARVSAC